MIRQYWCDKHSSPSADMRCLGCLLDGLESDNAAMEDALMQTEAEQAQLQQENADLKAQVESLKQESNDKSASMRALMKTAADHLSQIEALILEKERDRLGDSASVVLRLEKQVEDRTKVLEAERHKVAALKNDITQLKRDAESHRPQQILELREDIEDLRAGLIRIAREALDYVERD